jgi:nucleoside diphosphate kinase
MIEKTLFIIKPDGYNKREQIKSDISGYFELAETHLFHFYPELLAKLYPADVKQPHYPALLEYMLENLCELGIIFGESAIRRFYELTGEFSDPKECATNTLRYKYGKGLDTTKSGLYIVKNAIHRAKSREESEFELDLFRAESIIL